MLMFSFVDIAILVILITCFAIGFAKGLVKGVFTFTSLLIAILIARIYESRLAVFISSYGNIRENIKLWISENIIPFLNTSEGANGWMKAVNMYNLSKGAKGGVNSFWQNCLSSPGGFSFSFVNNAADIIIEIASFLLIFIGAYIILIILVEVLDFISKLPILNFLNRTGGGIIGLLKGGIYCFIIVTVLYFISIYLGSEMISTALNNSLLAPYFYLDFIFT